jgi:hypothetical protein
VDESSLFHFDECFCCISPLLKVGLAAMLPTALLQHASVAEQKLLASLFRATHTHCLPNNRSQLHFKDLLVAARTPAVCPHTHKRPLSQQHQRQHLWHTRTPLAAPTAAASLTKTPFGPHVSLTSSTFALVQPSAGFMVVYEPCLCCSELALHSDR